MAHHPNSPITRSASDPLRGSGTLHRHSRIAPYFSRNPWWTLSRDICLGVMVRHLHPDPNMRSHSQARFPLSPPPAETWRKKRSGGDVSPQWSSPQHSARPSSACAHPFSKLPLIDLNVEADGPWPPASSLPQQTTNPPLVGPHEKCPPTPTPTNVQAGATDSSKSDLPQKPQAPGRGGRSCDRCPPKHREMNPP